MPCVKTRAWCPESRTQHLRWFGKLPTSTELLILLDREKTTIYINGGGENSSQLNSQYLSNCLASLFLLVCCCCVFFCYHKFSIHSWNGNASHFHPRFLPTIWQTNHQKIFPTFQPNLLHWNLPFLSSLICSWMCASFAPTPNSLSCTTMPENPCCVATPRIRS